MKKEEFLERAKRMHGDKYSYPNLSDTVGVYDTIEIVCPKHGSFFYEVRSHYNGAQCPACKLESKNIAFIEKAKAVHGDKYDYSKTNFYRRDKDVCIICPKHGEFFQTPGNHLKGAGCPECAKEQVRFKSDLDEFVAKSKEIHGDKYDYSKSEFKGLTKKICIICPEHGEFWQPAKIHMYGGGCQKCLGRNKTTDDYIKEAKSVHGDKYDYSKTVYNGVFEPVCIICPEHGEFWQDPHNHLKGAGCPTCNESHLEVQIRKMLTNSGISFTSQFNDKWLGRQELDFYLPDYNVAIECQGGQHFEPIEFFGGEEGFKTRQELDLRKYNLCKENGVRLLYFSNVKEDLFLGERVIHDENELLVEIKESGSVLN